MLKIISLDVVDSTNKYAKEHLLELEDRTIIYTENQTNGKGRMSRSWVSSSNSLTFSYILKDNYSLNNFATISLLAGASVYLSLSKYVEKGLSIKWPNDINYYDSKISGILLESVSMGTSLQGIVIGIGINVNNTMKELNVTDRKITSLFNINSHKYDLKVILNDVIGNFEYLYNDALNGNNLYYQIFNEHNYLTGKIAFANINGTKKRIKVLGLNNDNTLKVEYKKSIYNLSSGEITFH